MEGPIVSLFTVIKIGMVLFKASPILAGFITVNLVLLLILLIKYIKMIVNEVSIEKRLKMIGFAILFTFVSPTVCYVFVSAFYPIFN